tara:strand:- start:36 stop:305 length:270 start_codon:yes stop_codon:yes gene_type:complete
VSSSALFSLLGALVASLASWWGWSQRQARKVSDAREAQLRVELDAKETAAEEIEEAQEESEVVREELEERKEEIATADLEELADMVNDL